MPADRGCPVTILGASASGVGARGESPQCRNRGSLPFRNPVPRATSSGGARGRARRRCGRRCRRGRFGHGGQGRASGARPSERDRRSRSVHVRRRSNAPRTSVPPLSGSATRSSRRVRAGCRRRPAGPRRSATWSSTRSTGAASIPTWSRRSSSSRARADRMSLPATMSRRRGAHADPRRDGDGLPRDGRRSRRQPAAHAADR